MVRQSPAEELAGRPELGRHNEDWRRARIITAGFPCQDVSLAGDGAALFGERSGLVRYVVGAVRLVRPLYTILENVAALLNRGMGEVLGALAESGCDAEWDCIRTGFPLGHERERVFIVADDCSARLQGGGAARTHASHEGNIFTRRRFAKFLTPANPAEKWGDRPLLGRGIHGIPNRAHRIEGVGNSINPEIAELIGNAINERTVK